MAVWSGLQTGSLAMQMTWTLQWPQSMGPVHPKQQLLQQVQLVSHV